MNIAIKISLFLLYYTFVNIKKITIDKLIAGGDGIGFIDGKVHFIPGVLPGEIVEIEIVENKKGFNRCKLIKVLTKSKSREPSFCPIYELCGGCNLQFTSYENQLEIKKQIVTDIFLRSGKTKLKDFSIISSFELGYRNRVQLHTKNNIRGFKQKQSDKIIEVKNCPLLVDGLNNLLAEKQDIKDGRMTLFSDGIDNYIGGVDKECTVSIMGKEISFNPNCFFQSNLSLIPDLVSCLNKYVLGQSVMDLYCGVGLFSIFLPENIKNIIAVEMDDRVEPFINKNLKDRPYTFYGMSLETYIKRGLHKKNVVDTIIVDPPRKGLSKEVREFLSKSKVKRILYVSCDPVTMARDIADLKIAGYDLIHFQCFDFYPYTTHIESFGVLDLD